MHSPALSFLLGLSVAVGTAACTKSIQPIHVAGATQQTQSQPRRAANTRVGAPEIKEASLHLDLLPDGLKPDGQPMETKYHAQPETPVLSQTEVTALLGAAVTLGLPKYALSGCHDRAHMLWLGLPKELRSKTIKLWIFGPRALTLALTDPITIKGVQNTPKWGYHVAVAYKTAGGLRVVDSTVPASLEREYSAQEWLNLYSIPHISMVTLLPPELYLFYSNVNVPSSVLSNTNQASLLNTGAFFTYQGKSSEEQFIENALARDEVGQALLAQPTACKDLSTIASNPDALLAALQKPLTVTKAACGPTFDQFTTRKDHWHQLVTAAQK
jgi:hypothetical protein